MEALGIVDGVDERPRGKRLASLMSLEAAAIDFFVLEGLHEALGFCIVVRVAGSAHADRYIVVGEALAIIGRGILHAAIGMMNQTGMPGLAIGKSKIQCLQGKRGIEMGSQRPADHLAREAIENGRRDRRRPRAGECK